MGVTTDTHTTGSAPERGLGLFCACGTLAILFCASACSSSRPRGAQAGASSDPIAAAEATERGDWRDAADRWYSVYLADHGESANPVAQTARALLMLKDAESANSMIDIGLEKHPDDADLLELKGDALFALHYRRPAEKYYQRAIDVDPKRARALEGLARVRVELGLDGAAVAPLQQLVRLEEGNYEAHAMLARALKGAGNAPGAFDAWGNAFALAPGSVDDVLAASALVLEPEVRRSRSDACATARAWLQRTIASDPQCTRAHFELGVVCEEMNTLDAAIEHYRRAVETDPACLMALTNLAVLYSKRGDEPHTREMVTRALQLEQDADRRKALARLLEPFSKASKP